MTPVTASEPAKPMVLDVGKIKSFTGDRWGKGRGMHRDWERFPYTHKVVLLTNPKPIIRETTDAIWDRLHLLHWRYRVPDKKEDQYLHLKLEKEWPYILVWLVEGCLKWRKDGHLKPSKDVEEETLKFRAESDVLSEFCEQRVEFGPPSKGRVSRTDLYRTYETWAGEQNIQMRYWLTKKQFEVYFVGKGYKHDYANYEGSSKDCWFGIALKGVEG